MTGAALRVLLVSEDVDLAHAVEHVVREEGDAFEHVLSIDAAVVSATAQPVDVAFIELACDGGAALALCHHLPTVCPAIVASAAATSAARWRVQITSAADNVMFVVWPIAHKSAYQSLSVLGSPRLGLWYESRRFGCRSNPCLGIRSPPLPS